VAQHFAQAVLFEKAFLSEYFAAQVIEELSTQVYKRCIGLRNPGSFCHLFSHLSKNR
jgi:hypothetical protein